MKLVEIIFPLLVHEVLLCIDARLSRGIDSSVLDGIDASKESLQLVPKAMLTAYERRAPRRALLPHIAGMQLFLLLFSSD